MFLDEAGTAQRPNMMMIVMAFSEVKRFSMADDPLQLSALIFNSEIKNLWQVAIFRFAWKNNHESTITRIWKQLAWVKFPI